MHLQLREQLPDCQVCSNLYMYVNRLYWWFCTSTIGLTAHTLLLFMNCQTWLLREFCKLYMSSMYIRAYLRGQFHICSWFPAHNYWIYMLTRDGWRFRRACSTVHKFSEDVIRERRAALEEKKVSQRHQLAELEDASASLLPHSTEEGRERFKGQKREVPGLHWHPAGG